jgi:hypothetical protein
MKGAVAASASLVCGGFADSNTRAKDSAKETGTPPGLILREKDPDGGCLCLSTAKRRGMGRRSD